MANTFTTEEMLPGSFLVTDGHTPPRVVEVDGQPVVTSSDETVATVTIGTRNVDGSYDVAVSSVTPGECRVTVEADADLGAGVQSLIAFGDLTVTLDPASGARISTLTFGAAVPKT